LYSGKGEQQMFCDAKDYEYSVKRAVIEENEKIVLKGARTNNFEKINRHSPYLSITLHK